jgi:hypothetical protein
MSNLLRGDLSRDESRPNKPPQTPDSNISLAKEIQPALLKKRVNFNLNKLKIILVSSIKSEIL